MNIRETVLNLQKIYEEMSLTFSAFQEQSGLSCFSGCGRCCINPDVEASILEMLPFALKILDEGKLDQWMERLDSLAGGQCVLFEGNAEAGSGKCGHYQERPAVCRMFGAAGYFSKQKEVKLSVCKFIKEAHPEKLKQLENEILTTKVPMIPLWYSLISHCGPESLQRRVPINEAMAGALKKVALYAQYQAY